MKFSLINIHGERDGKPYGSWLQDHIGDLESATQAAIDTEKANSNKIDVAVVKEVNSVVPNLSLFRFINRLDTSRRTN